MGAAIRREDVAVPLAGAVLDGDLVVPANAGGIVVFAHGSGSGRHSPRNRLVAERLNAVGLGTLLFDLLTAEEEREDLKSGRLRFDIDLLGDRVTAGLDWLRAELGPQTAPVGCFGASTGAAAALIAAAERPEVVRAVVSRGGRPDLAPAALLGEVRAPTLLIVGADDAPVIEMNRAAQGAMRAETRLEIVPGATHLFEEPGKLEQVADLAREWFLRHLSSEDR
ncbi:MAG: hypothetical protein E6G10_01965 [Actinobacteria bacterium]|nr:MAG: hypothetical protein E6G10_01965 [Actinomycetota bacterium]